MKSACGLLILVALFSSCSKTDDIKPLPVINEVSGKIKQITTGVPGTKIATVETFTYDNAGRVREYKWRTNDSSLNPVIQSSHYFLFSYDGLLPQPVSATHTNHTGTINEITYFNYDRFNRIIHEERYSNGVLTDSSSYNYLTLAFTRITAFGSPVLPKTVDTVWQDSSRNILRTKSYSTVSPYNASAEFTLTYDHYKNPVGETNIGSFLKSYFVRDNDVFNLTPNNLLSRKGNKNGVPYDVESFYYYSTNGFPVNSILSNNATTVFEYF